MLALAGMSWSFDTAAERLEELCLLKVSNDTIRRVSEEEGQAAQRWIAQSDCPAELFQQACGDQEFYTDGVTVNTTEGWRDLRLNVVGKREAGLPATPEQWKDRVLPEPSVRIAWASMAACEQQGQAWKRMSRKLGVIDDENLSVLADGAKWIWDQAGHCWKKAQWVLDVFHVSQHIHGCGKALFGEKSPQARPWSQAQWYRQRLADGRPIGSGLIEGANKTIVSNRLKLNSARWTPRHAEAMAALRCLDYSGLWSDFWADQAA